MKLVNANAIYNALNGGLVIIGLITGGLLAAGCVENAAGVLDCSNSFINPAYAGDAIALIGVLKFAMNIGRDGLSGLFKQQPPVAK